MSMSSSEEQQQTLTLPINKTPIKRLVTYAPLMKTNKDNPPQQAISPIRPRL